jgi:hypothetical protein
MRKWSSSQKINSIHWRQGWFGSGAPTQKKQYEQDRDRDSQGPKQDPPHLPLLVVTHSDPPFLSDSWSEEEQRKNKGMLSVSTAPRWPPSPLFARRFRVCPLPHPGQRSERIRLFLVAENSRARRPPMGMANSQFPMPIKPPRRVP